MNKLCTGLLLLALLTGCGAKEGPYYATEVMNRMTPVKDQGRQNSCWIYAMLAAIETEHLSWGDSVNLSAAYIEKALESEKAAPASGRGMGVTLLRLLGRHGVVGYNAMPTISTPPPRFVFMLGAEYTPQEFARSVCAPGEYIALTSRSDAPYFSETVIEAEDNWTRERFLNVPADTLLAVTERAVRNHHGVCWESNEHAMAIVGIAHDDHGNKYFIMKNSWGTDRPHGGLDYLSLDDFRRQTLAVEMTREAYAQSRGTAAEQ